VLHAFDPRTASAIAADRAAALRRSWQTGLHTSAPWTGERTSTAPGNATPTGRHASPMIRTPVSANSHGWAMPLQPPASHR
jgi:hypothetical protein